MSYYVYILASRRDGAIYIGVTNDIVRRVYEHRIKAVPGFTAKYNITRLVWFEIHDDPISAISREKELKKWRRGWKVQLIERKTRNDSTCTTRFATSFVSGAVRQDRTRNLEIPVRASRAPE